MPLAPGTSLGPYEIAGALGAGGMGEVYRAHDSRLGRDVALKILPPAVAGDPVRRARFEIEARAVAALNHPNIVALYDVGDGYMVNELVDGHSLRGAKPGLRKALEIATQIAEGLAAAHAAGITHRDLKPENILLTREGRVKILDFGLAKVRVAQASADSETITVQTDPGMVMGTIGYMSPEQVRGETVDHRSDIFNLGLVLHELLAGKRTFHGDTSIETMNAILKQDAPELPKDVPSGVQQIILRCLEKEPGNRFQSAKDLAFALSHALAPSGPSPAIAERTSRMPGMARAAAALVAIAGAVLAGRLVWQRDRPPDWSATILTGPEVAVAPRLSPDGHTLAMIAIVDGQSQVALMTPETGNWRVLTHDRTRGLIGRISWSPDGASIYYNRFVDVPLGIYNVPVLGGEERLVLENADAPEALPDGSLLAFRINSQQHSQLFRFWPDSGRTQDLAAQEAQPVNAISYANGVERLGKADAILFGVPLGKDNQPPSFLAVHLSTGEVRQLAAPSVRCWTTARDGKSIIAAVPAGAVTRIVSIPAAGSGERTLFTVTAEVWNLDTGADGSIYAGMVDRPSDVVKFALDGAPAERLASFPRVYEPDMLAVLADGRVVLPAGDSGHVRLIVATKDKDPVPLVSTAEETGPPVTPTGPGELAFAIGPAPRQTIAIADVSKNRITRRLQPGKGALYSLAASPDGRTVYLAAGGRIWSMPKEGGEIREICQGSEVVAHPDGRSLVVVVYENSKAHLFQVPLDGSTRREIVLEAGHYLNTGFPLSPGSIRPDGRMLLSLLPLDTWFNPIGLVDLNTGRVAQKWAESQSDYHTMAWAPDGRIVALRMGMRGAIWKFSPLAH